MQKMFNIFIISRHMHSRCPLIQPFLAILSGLQQLIHVVSQAIQAMG